ncbi:unnamed protein product [Linum tenue]|uniref:Uncharacterized protein n=1 Tax=Linum tenue TaxID=586396 RepID=A0AAV0GZF6_9ROSI|nr:unnamed protein product [Linum tenue]
MENVNCSGMMRQLRQSPRTATMSPMMNGEIRKRWILTMLDQLKPMLWLRLKD